MRRAPSVCQRSSGRWRGHSETKQKLGSHQNTYWNRGGRVRAELCPHIEFWQNNSAFWFQNCSGCQNRVLAELCVVGDETFFRVIDHHWIVSYGPVLLRIREFIHGYS
ncbi:hypothetical protein M6B38_377025 [Iris pallida]|uniref:Uncharacterized protein n=1 Tax=Iris pallida TaxID=29817 RepID=A0AAX6GAZ8_IRIPA|nr:hypothetical protein M6B38_377025 [Iris pallida]